MSNPPSVAVQGCGLVTSVGLTAPATCAAIRAKLTNPSETRFIDSDGHWIMAHEVQLEEPWRGLPKLARMAAMAIEESLAGVPRAQWSRIPLLLCVAEQNRPGRQEGLDDQLFIEVRKLLDNNFAPQSAIVPHGRVAAIVAVGSARRMLAEADCPCVVVASVDSLLSWPSLAVYERGDRLLTQNNSNGFMPGEAAAAVRLVRAGGGAELRCTGLGFGIEKNHIDSGEPLRADGMAQAIKQALAEAGQPMHGMDYRITDLSGEQYYFKEASLALSRTMRQRKTNFDIWHPAESIGETGAAAGIVMLAVADAASRKRYSPGPNILLHAANDGGQRAAAVFQFAESP